MSASERAAEVLAAHSVDGFWGLETACACDRRWRRNAEYRQHVAEALAAAGLLAEPTDQGETRTEWGVRQKGMGEHAHVDYFQGPWPEEFSRLTVALARRNDPTAALIRREVSTGPWVEVPS